jgi:aspartate oxidase
MWDYVGIVRSDLRLQRVLRRLELITGEIERIADNYITYAGWYK